MCTFATLKNSIFVPMKLSELKTGEKALIVKLSGYGGFRKRIVEMGFVKGKIVEAVNVAPLRDPIEYYVMGYRVSLRRSEADNIEVISMQEAETIAKQQRLQNDYHGTITEDDIRQVALDRRKAIKIAFVGNPNCGKTSLFNAVTGEHERVGNYSGVTVDAVRGKFDYKGYHLQVVDLPGTYSLSAYSPEEAYVRKHIIEEQPDVVVNVVDASNLERNLFLTTQLLDMNVRMVIALNMYDELQERGDKLDYHMLARLLGVPIQPTVTPKHQGINELFDMVLRIYEGSDILDKEGRLISTVENDELLDKLHHDINLSHKHNDDESNSDNGQTNELYTIVRHIHINYGPELESAIKEIKAAIEKNAQARIEYTPRYQALKFLEKDREMEPLFKSYDNYNELCDIREKSTARIEKELHDTPENAIMEAKYGFISGALKETLQQAKPKKGKTRTDKIDNVVTSRIWGYPIFLLALLLMFEATFMLGQYPMDWIESLVGWIGVQLGNILPEGMLKDLLVDGIIGGVGGVLVFLPNILILYFCIALLEATGYMARAAFIMDKLMHKIGLHGRSFIPLIMGFGCNVPAIMATRTIENRNNRMVTILISPLISCSARLPIYLLLAGTFFPNHAGFVLFAIYMTGILLAALMAVIFKRFLFFKEETPFVMELPPYRAPGILSLLRYTWDKGAQYLKKIGTTILLGSIIIWALSYFPRYENPDPTKPLTAEMVAEQQANSYLGRIGKAISPIMEPLGFEWKTSVAVLSGIAAKEVVVSTLGVLFNEGDDSESGLGQRLATEIRADGTPLFSPAVALSLMLFVLIYIPCIGTIATIKHETGSWWWAVFVSIYTILLAWIVSFIVYQSIVHNIWQSAVVGLIIFIALWAILARLRKALQAKSRCQGCAGCHAGTTNRDAQLKDNCNDKK